MEIQKIETNKKQYLSLLLLADEQEDMVDRYLERGTMYVLLDGGVKAECVVTDEGGVLEIKNIAVAPACQGRGYGRALVAFLEETYGKTHVLLQAGTGDSPATVPFYETCGFARAGVVKNFFLENYDHPIYESGVRLRDMVYFQKPISPSNPAGLSCDSGPGRV